MSKIAVNEITNEAGTGGPTLPNGVAGGLTLGGDLTLDTNGIYLGGTGSANYLDDYEEGTWTPSVTVGSIGEIVSATYTKIGRLVTVTCFLRELTDSTSSDLVTITGLPFLSGATSSGSVHGERWNYAGAASLIEASVNEIRFNSLTESSSNYSLMRYSDNLSVSDNDLRFTITYETS